MRTLCSLPRGFQGFKPRTMVRSSSYLAGRPSPFHETYGDYRTERFMERGPTLYQHQNVLPRLPVPSLEETFARYIQTVQPLTTEAEYQRTIAAAREFLQPGGLVSNCMPLSCRTSASVCGLLQRCVHLTYINLFDGPCFIDLQQYLCFSIDIPTSQRIS